MPKERVDSLLSAFGRLPQRVIVKFDNPVAGAPKNVLIKPFLPQQDILAHPKTILFVTHCGMHGVMEAIYHRYRQRLRRLCYNIKTKTVKKQSVIVFFRVPMVGMPVFIDQGDVLVRMEEKGIAFGIEKNADSDTIYNGIVRVRDDDKYVLKEIF